MKSRGILQVVHVVLGFLVPKWCQRRISPAKAVYSPINIHQIAMQTTLSTDIRSGLAPFYIDAQGAEYHISLRLTVSKFKSVSQ